MKNVFVSWNKAANFCNDVGGNLPFITSRDKQEEILGIFYVNNDRLIPPTEALYLGLSFGLQHKVCNFAFSEMRE